MADWRAQLERVVTPGETPDSKELNLASKYFGDSGCMEVVEKLQGAETPVRTLWLDFCEIGEAGAAALGNLLRKDREGGTALETLGLANNDIGAEGVIALADALRQNTTLKTLFLHYNPGVFDPDGSADTSAGVDALVAAIGVNTTLERVSVSRYEDGYMQQEKVDAALADIEGRRVASAAGPKTKPARS
jgi:Leucine Rich repeat